MGQVADSLVSENRTSFPQRGQIAVGTADLLRDGRGWSSVMLRRGPPPSQDQPAPSLDHVRHCPLLLFLEALGWAAPVTAPVQSGARFHFRALNPSKLA